MKIEDFRPIRSQDSAPIKFDWLLTQESDWIIWPNQKITLIIFWLVASTVQDGFFPYLVQMINSMRGCVACDDLWPWPISSRSFGLDLENRVRFVASTVLDGFFSYLAQMITINRGCRVLHFFQNQKIWIFGKFLKFFGLDLEKKNLQFSIDSFHI